MLPLSEKADLASAPGQELPYKARDLHGVFHVERITADDPADAIRKEGAGQTQALAELLCRTAPVWSGPSLILQANREREESRKPRGFWLDLESGPV